MLENALPVSAIAKAASSISPKPTLCGFVNSHLISTVSLGLRLSYCLLLKFKSSQPLWPSNLSFLPSASPNKYFNLPFGPGTSSNSFIGFSSNEVVVKAIWSL